MFGSASRIAWPRWVISARPRLTVGTMAGESPSKGSSSSSIAGSRASARATESILRSPPLISGPLRARYFRSARTTAWARSIRSAAGRPPGRVHVEISMFSATVRSGKMPLSSGEKASPRRAISWVRRPWMSSSRSRIRPARGRRYPMIVRRVVDLPAPLRPTRHTTSPSFTSRDTWRRMWLDWMKTSTASTLSTRTSPSSRAAPDHRVDHARVGADRGGRRVGEHPALVERDDAVRVAEHDVHVVLDLDDRAQADAPGRGHQDLHHRVLVGGAHPAGRLVQQDDLGTERERGGHVEQLLVPLG